MPYKDKEKNKEYQRKWARRNRAKQREYQRSIRIKVLEYLGDKCVYCGCDIPEALEINHVNGGGNIDQRTRGKSTKGYHLSILNGSRLKDEFELVCRICNNWHYLVKLKGIEDRWTITFK